jgi:hypothetical protein
MDSFEFFRDKEFSNRWKGKSGIYILEQPVFTNVVGHPVFKVGFARFRTLNLLNVAKCICQSAI